MKPVERSKLRIYLGTMYYRSRRFVEWLVGKAKFARNKQEELLPHSIFQHQTPLIRHLKDVDMWLQHNKVTNLKQAIQRLNHIFLKSSEA
ncbi:hypothetical protein BVG16_27225 [Paenibacillus selenitireducens]|uniref:Uncharacterized protein n=1 Tax=Paenibacillus selenitireducens TaxID=1324314 RepID=A0A1T2X1R3_9BACL|nr:hypothetical protein [Paenibacillus selenitireducens]OPA73777.1 hypothetical protein BVG16_27225 [Paenibacillus selenitireducens]